MASIALATWFNPLASIEDLTSQLPRWGVVKILDGPYNLSKPAVERFFGAGSNVLPKDLGESVHIIMDRITGKNFEAFVEFLTQEDAIRAVNRMNNTPRTSALRLGDRKVTVELSSQDELLGRFFSKAKNITWSNGTPSFTTDPRLLTMGHFRSFISEEELGNLHRAASGEDRARLTGFLPSHPIRVYQNMTSVIWKFPWAATSLYTISKRDAIFSCTREMMESLVQKIMIAMGDASEDRALLWNLLYASVCCSGFSERQKFALAQIASRGGVQFPVHTYAETWPFETLHRVAGVDDTAVNTYLSNLAEGGRRYVLRTTPQAWPVTEPRGGPQSAMFLSPHITIAAAIETEQLLERAWRTEFLSSSA